MISLSKKYKTRNGYLVELLTVNGKGKFPVIGYVYMPDYGWNIFSWTAEGGRLGTGEESSLDLVEISDIKMTDEQIKHMVDRFLMWPLPSSFNPDGGITFEKIGNKGTPYEYIREPIGTNLFDATQAEEMVRFIVDGLSV